MRIGLMQSMQQNSSGQLDQIETFAAIVEHGSFAAAARVLGRDASVLSRRMEALEARLGARLLTRTTRKVSLTEVGAAYVEKVRTILTELGAADAEASEGAVRPRGVLRMSMPVTFANWIVPWLPGFLEHHPELKVELHLGDRYVDLIEEGVDLAIRIGRLADSSLKVRQLAGFETILCASPGYLASHGTPSSIDDLKNHRCLGHTKAHSWPDWPLRSGGERVTAHVSGQIRCDDGGTMVLAGLNGGGIMLASEWTIGRDLAAGRLVRILPDWRFGEDGVAQIVLPPGRLVPAKTRVMIDRIIEEFSPIAPWHR